MNQLIQPQQNTNPQIRPAPPTKIKAELPTTWKTCLLISLVIDCMEIVIVSALMLILSGIISHFGKVSGSGHSPFQVVWVTMFVVFITTLLTKIILISTNLLKKKVKFFILIVIFFFLTGGIVGIILGIICLLQRDEILHPILPQPIPDGTNN